MAKPKKVLKQLNVVWELIEAAMYIDKLKAKPNAMDLMRIYRGNYLPCYYDKRVNPKCLWELTLTVTFLDANKEQHIDTLNFSFGTPMTFNEMIAGNSSFIVEEAGFKTVWQGVSHEWKLYSTKQLKDCTVVSAWATAVTTSPVKPLNFSHANTEFASKLNSDFRTGKYLI